MATAAQASTRSQPGVCLECGCTEFDPCIDMATGETCGWANRSRTYCSFCADMLMLGDDDIDPDVIDDVTEGDNNIQIYSEADCDRYLRERRTNMEHLSKNAAPSEFNSFGL